MADAQHGGSHLEARSRRESVPIPTAWLTLPPLPTTAIYCLPSEAHLHRPARQVWRRSRYTGEMSERFMSSFC